MFSKRSHQWHLSRHSWMQSTSRPYVTCTAVLPPALRVFKVFNKNVYTPHISSHIHNDAPPPHIFFHIWSSDWNNDTVKCRYVVPSVYFSHAYLLIPPVIPNTTFIFPVSGITAPSLVPPNKTVKQMNIRFCNLKLVQNFNWHMWRKYRKRE